MPYNEGLVETNKAIVKAINEGLERSFVLVKDRKVAPVCFCCDKFVRPSNITYMKIDNILSVKEFLMPRRNLPRAVVEYYTYNGDESCLSLSECLISPRSVYVEKGKGSNKYGSLICCNTCNDSLNKKI